MLISHFEFKFGRNVFDKSQDSILFPLYRIAFQPIEISLIQWVPELGTFSIFEFFHQ